MLQFTKQMSHLQLPVLHVLLKLLGRRVRIIAVPWGKADCLSAQQAKKLLPLTTYARRPFIVRRVLLDKGNKHYLLWNSDQNGYSSIRS